MLGKSKKKFDSGPAGKNPLVGYVVHLFFSYHYEFGLSLWQMQSMWPQWLQVYRSFSVPAGLPPVFLLLDRIITKTRMNVNARIKVTSISPISSLSKFDRRSFYSTNANRRPLLIKKDCRKRTIHCWTLQLQKKYNKCCIKILQE